MGFQAACVSGMNAPTYILKILVRGAHLSGLLNFADLRANRLRNFTVVKHECFFGKT